MQDLLNRMKNQIADDRHEKWSDSYRMIYIMCRKVFGCIPIDHWEEFEKIDAGDYIDHHLNYVRCEKYDSECCCSYTSYAEYLEDNDEEDSLDNREIFDNFDTGIIYWIEEPERVFLTQAECEKFLRLVNADKYLYYPLDISKMSSLDVLYQKLME